MNPKSKIYNLDCMDKIAGLYTYPDNHFDLAIVDPPYGIGIGKYKTMGKRAKTKLITTYKQSDWDSNIPDESYFKELFRVSKNQIIWGGNYFIEHLYNTRCVLFWDKQYIPAGFSMSDCEMAWTSFDKSAKRVRVKVEHNNISNNEYKAALKAKIHQAQKPVGLYAWLLENYAKEGDTILDTHLGSGSSRIAAYKLGFDFTGYEIDGDYFNDSQARFDKEINGIIQQSDGTKLTQGKLFE